MVIEKKYYDIAQRELEEMQREINAEKAQMSEEEILEDKNIIDAMIEIMANVYISDRDTYKISGEEIPVNEVQNRIKTLIVQHIEYIIECLNRNTREIRKPDNYLLASLYNAPLTIGLYYKAQVQHDFKMENTVV